MSRLSGLKCPSGKGISYGYDSAGQVTAICEGFCETAEGSGSDDEAICDGRTEIVRYLRDGAGRFMTTTCVQPEISLDYRSGGFDRYGRIVDHAWRDANGVALVQISHGYDVAGNRENRQDGVNPLWSESYDYDEMGQVTSLQRID